MQAEDGTHSILDMIRVSHAPAAPNATLADHGAQLLAAIAGERTTYGTVHRMSAEQLEACFGTTTPTRGVVEAKADAVHAACARGMGLYGLVFDTTVEPPMPVATFFAGISGD